MSKLKKELSFETTFGIYVVDELIGEGGAGRVFGGVGPDDAKVALKVLDERTSKEKRRRFKTEIAFLARNRHPSITTLSAKDLASGPRRLRRRRRRPSK